METRFNTGDSVLVPAIIEAAREENGGIVYEVRVNSYEVPEDAVSENYKSDVQRAMQSFIDDFKADYGWR